MELNVRVSKAGGVKDIQIISGAEPLALAAKAALLNWQFTGCTSEKGECEARFLVSFVLAGSCSASENCPSTFEVDLPGKITVTAKSIRAIVN